MKSPLNFQIKKGGNTYDMHELGIWVASFHIYSPNLTRNKLSIPGRPGAYLVSTQEDERHVRIVLQIETDDISELNELKHIIFDLFYSDQEFSIVRDMTPGKEMFVIQEGEYDIENVSDSDGEFEITLTMLNPYLYGPRKSMPIDPANPIVLAYKGTAPGKPIFRFNVTQPTTMIEYANGEEYMAIGQPDSVDSAPYHPYTSILVDELQSTVGWARSSIPLDLGANVGEMISFGEEFGATDYGTGTSWHGPAVQKTFSSIQDFKCQVFFNVQVTNSKQRGRAEAYLVASDLSVIGKIIVTCPNSSQKASVSVYLRNGTTTKYILHQADAYMNGFHGWVTIERKGTEYKIEVGTDGWDANLKYVVYSRETFTFRDLNSDFQRPFAGVVLHVGAWASAPLPYRARIRAVKIFRINNQEGTPYIVNPGDTVVIDHEKELILVNDEPRVDLKDFGATFFELRPGDNTIVCNPPDAFTAEIEWRERYR